MRSSGWGCRARATASARRRAAGSSRSTAAGRGATSSDASAVARGHAEALIDRLDAARDAQALGLLGVEARELGELGAQEVQAGVELGLGGVGAARHAHRAVDARLGLRPRVARVDLAPQLRPAAGEAIQRAALVLPAAGGGGGARAWGGRARRAPGGGTPAGGAAPPR